MIDVAEFIGVKSHRAKGKRLTTYEVAELKFIEPIEEPEEANDEDAGYEDSEDFELDTKDGIAPNEEEFEPIELIDETPDIKIEEREAIATKIEPIDNVPFEIECPEEEHYIDSTQLNLF